MRALLIIPTAWFLVTLVFFLMRGIGDPITAAAGGRLTPAQIAERKAAAGFDRPLLAQYWEYLSGLFHGDFGTTLTDKRPITDILVVNGAATLELAFWALLVALIIGIPLGLYAATHRDRFPDVVLRLLAVLFYAAPVFFVGMLLKLFFSVKLGWLPASGRYNASTEIALANVRPQTHIAIIDAILYGDSTYIVDVLKHAVLPALALGLLTAGVFLRLVRVNMLQTLRAGYIDAARARGLSEGVVVRTPRVPQRAGARRDGDGHADRAAAGRRGAHRDHVRVERAGTATGALSFRARLRGRAGHRHDHRDHRGGDEFRHRPRGRAHRSESAVLT